MIIYLIKKIISKVKDKSDETKEKIDDTVDGMKKNNSSPIPVFE